MEDDRLGDGVGLEQLLSFFRARGHHMVPNFGSTRPLFLWAAEVRSRWRMGELPAPLARRLEAVHFPFDERALVWERSFAQVAKLARGHGRLPPQSTPLGAWVRGQLTLGELGALDLGLFERLKALQDGG